MPQFRSIVLRVSHEDRVLYANEAFCRYAGKPRAEIEGCSVKDLAAMTTGEVSECFASIQEHSQPNALVTDRDGRVFEVKTARELGALDIVLDEVTNAEQLGEVLRDSSGTPLEELDEDELRTLRNPDLRFVTICRARLQTEGKTTGALSPMDHRILTNAFIEELSEALISKGCTIMPNRASGVAGLSGAPRHHADHALRALEAAFEQISRAARLKNSLFAEGREMPPIGWAIASGDAVVGTFGGFRSMCYTAEGRCVELAERIAALASPGEVLVTEPTLVGLLENLPEGWSSVRTVREADPDLAPYASHAGSIQPIDGNNQRGVWIVGPGVAEDWQKAVFIFDYLWSFQSGLMREPVPVLRAIRLGGVAEHIPLSIDRVPNHGFVHRLGKYRLLSVIGHGGMGRVWKAQDIYGNTVAIKTLNAPQAESPESVKRFRREAEVMARLQHRNICRVFEMNEHEGSQYIVMEFVDGLSLADVLYSGIKSTVGKEDISSLIEAARAAKESSNHQAEHASPSPAKGEEPPTDPRATLRLQPEQALAIFLKVCSAVEFAHNHGVLHRDLKPANILLRGDGEPLVADFGLAKLSSENTGASLSLSGNVLGTVENMAPEQAASSKSVDARADVYSLGTILFQMVTGKRHFEASGTLLADIQTLQTHEPPRPRSINPQVDPDLELIILKCLRQNPTERYRGVAALLADIERYHRGETISARPVTAVEVLRKLIQRNRAASIVAGAALVLILLIVAGAVWSLKRQLDISEQNKNLAEQRLREIEEKDLLVGQKEEDQKIAEMSKQELQKLFHETEAKLKATAVELEENRNELQFAQTNIVAEKAKNQNAEDRIQNAEARARDLERQLGEARSAATTPPPLASGLLPPPASAQPVNMFEIQKELEGIESGFKQDFSQGSLAALERNPRKALDYLDKRIDDTASVLLKAPQSVHGWMLMGYLRLAALEFKSAGECFERALSNHGTLTIGRQSIELPTQSYLRNVPQNRLAVSSVAEPAARLRDFARQSSQTRPVFGKDGPALADPLRQIRDPRGLSLTTADAISFFTSKPQTMTIAPAASPMRREASDKEIALQLLVDNDLSTAPIVKMTQPKELDVTMEGNAKNLSSIASQTKVLTIRNAQQVDYQSLLNFPKLTRLDLSGSSLSDKPPLPKPERKLAHLGLANTNIQSLDFVVGTSLSMGLQSLDVGGCRLENIQGLGLLRSLRELTITPDLLQKPANLKLLENLSSNITYIRTPNDPRNQTRLEFFRKYLPSNQN